MQLQSPFSVLRLLIAEMVVLNCCQVFCEVYPDIPGYFKWSPDSYNTRVDLYCPDSCKRSNYEDSQECCACDAKRCWEVVSEEECDVTIADLHLEYIGIMGESQVVAKPEEGSSTYYSLNHQNGRLSTLPKNFCSFQNLVTLNLAHNYIKQLDNISCLIYLNHLNVQNNKLTNIKSNTFGEMKNLRTIDISDNLMSVIEPDTFTIANGNIFHINASQSTVKQIDVNNLYDPGLFCTRNFSRISAEVVNKNNFSLNTKGNISVVGPGEIILGTLKHEPFDNITEIGVDFPDLTKILHMSIEFDVAAFYCDCTTVPFMKNMGIPAVLKFWPALLEGFTCTSPEELEGVVLDQYFTNKTLDMLTCKIIEDCPWKCRCTDFQNQQKVLVNCTATEKTIFPGEMPTGYWNNRKLEILLDGNNIRHTEGREWLKRTEMISFARNPFNKLDAIVIEYLPDNAKLDLSGLVLNGLPRNIMRKNLDNINFDGTIVTCDCSNTWIGDWIRGYQAKRKIQCDVNGDLLFAEQVSDASLGCIEEDSIKPIFLVGSIVSGIFIIIFAFLLIHYFHYEIIILKKRLFRKKKQEPNQFLYNTFISFDDRDEWVFHWVIRDRGHKHFRETISERLTKERYSFFIPYLHIMPGEKIEELTALKADKCATFLIILSENYEQNESCRLQFNIIWQQYRAYTDKQIIMVDFDTHNKPGINVDRRIRALLRVNDPLRFEARNDRVIDRLLNKLGKPNPLAYQNHETIELQDIDDTLEEPAGQDSDDSVDNDKTDADGKYNCDIRNNIRTTVQRKQRVPIQKKAEPNNVRTVPFKDVSDFSSSNEDYQVLQPNCFVNGMQNNAKDSVANQHFHTRAISSRNRGQRRGEGSVNNNYGNSAFV